MALRATEITRRKWKKNDGRYEFTHGSVRHCGRGCRHMNLFAITSRESITSLALPLAAVFVVSLGYGVVLPFVLADALGEVERASVSWHTGMLTGVYMLSLFLFAPLWGYISDRIGRRTVILLGLAGVFAAAVLSVMLAWVSDVGASRTRAQAFAWLSAASALGFMFGPTLSGWLASVETAAQDTALALPFYATAALSGVVWLAAYRFLPENISLCVRGSEPERGVTSLMWLLALSLLVMLGFWVVSRWE